MDLAKVGEKDVDGVCIEHCKWVCFWGWGNFEHVFERAHASEESSVCVFIKIHFLSSWAFLHGQSKFLDLKVKEPKHGFVLALSPGSLGKQLPHSLEKSD